MKPYLLLRSLALFVACAVASHAQITLIWGNGTGTWDKTTANWTGSVWLDGSNATIGTGTARTGTVTIVPEGVTVNNVVSGSGGGAAYGYVLTGGSITLAGPTSTWSAGGPSGSQLLVESNINGASSLEKIGTRLLILAGTNTYTGGTIVTAGTLQIGNGGTTGSVAGDIAANSALIFNRSDAYDFGGIISGASAVTQAGSGTLILSADNVNTGNTVISAGTLQLGAGGTTGTVGGNIANEAALVFNRSDVFTFAGNITGAGTVAIGGTGTVLLDGASSHTGVTTVESGATLGGTGSLTGAVAISDGGTLLGTAGQLFTTGDLTFSSAANFDVTLGAPSASALVLVNGDLTLDGTLNIVDAGGFGPGLYRLFDYTGALTDNGFAFGLTGGASASSLAIQTATANEVNLFFDAGPANIWRGGAGIWNADPVGSGWTDVLGVIAEPWQTQFAIFTGTPGAVTIDTAAGAVEATGLQFAVDGYSVDGDALTNNTADAVFRVGNGTGAGSTMSGSISAAIVGTGGLDKNDLGTLVLSGANTYAGATTVSNGTLQVDGDQSGAGGATTVRTGATLAGGGTLGGAVTIEDGGTLAGQSGQTLSMGALALGAASHVDIALGAPSLTTLFDVNGDLTLDGTLNITDTGTFGPGVYRMFDYTGALTNNGIEFGTTPVTAQSLAVQTSLANQINLIFDAGPRNFWAGGDGTWTADPASTAWTEFTGSAATFWTPQFAIFQNAAGIVTIDTASGDVEATGAQFAIDGYTIAGGTLTNNTADAVFRVGDGSGAGAAMSATISAPITGTGGLDKTDLGTLILSGVNTYAGATTVSGGTLHVDGDQSGATGAATVLSGATLTGSGTLGGDVTIADGGTLAGEAGQTLSMGGLVLNAASNVDVTVGAPSATTLFNVGGNLTLDGTLNVADAGGFGPGIYRLIDYTGSLTNNGMAIGTAPVGAEFLSVQTSVANQVNLNFNVGASNFWTGGDGVWTADPTSTVWTDSNGFTSTSWTPQFAVFQNTPGAVTIDTASGAVVATGLQFAVNGYTVAGGTLTNDTAAAVFRVGDGTGAGAAVSATIAAPIAGTGGLDKTDLGTLILSGANTYSGATTVTDGTLRIVGDQSGATGATTVLTGAKLAGSGTIGGAVTVNEGGTLAGSAGSTLTMGALTLNAASNVDVTLGAPSTVSLFDVNGAITLDGTLNIASAPGFGQGLYRLFNYTGALTDNGIILGATAGVGASSFAVLTSTANQIDLFYRDLVTPLPFWTGGSGVWTGDPAGTGFSDETGTLTGGWRSGFAIFRGTPGTVTVDSTSGPVVITGIQFAVNGYTVTGATLTNDTSNATFRVGDGTAAGAAMSANLSATIAGTGGLNKTDLGTLILGGTNTYAGGTTVSGGVLQVSSNANLGAAGGGLALDGGTLRTTASFSSGRTVSLAAGGGTIDTGATTLTLSGPVTGAGSLTKTGSGRLTLSGANTYTGATTVSAGTLFMDNSSVSATTVAALATLSGNGTVRGNLTNSGTVSPGASPGTITVNGNYTQTATGTFLAEIASASSFDRLAITGTANLAGTLNVVGLGGYVPPANQSFTILSATGGITGTFSTVTTSWDQMFAMLSPHITYTASDVRFALAQRAFASLQGATPNQQSLGGALDQALTMNSVPTLQAALVALPSQGAVLSAIDELSPLRYERWFEQAVASAGSTVRSAERRLSEVQAGSGPALWLELARRETRFDAEGESRAAEGTANGIMVGGDVSVTPDFRIGILFSYTDETLELDTSGSETDLPRYGVAVYGRREFASSFIEAVGGFNAANLSTRRVIEFTGFNGVATGDTDTFEVHAGLRFGRPVMIGDTTYTPYAGLNFVRWQANGFDEDGAGPASLVLLSQDGDSLASRIGFTASRSVKMDGWTLVPEIDLAWRNEFNDGTRRIAGSLGGGSFDLETRRPNSGGFVGAFGIMALFSDSFSAFAQVSTERNGGADKTTEARAGVTFRY